MLMCKCEDVLIKKMKKIYCILILTIVFASCKKDNKTYNAIYKVVTDGNTPDYTVRYTLSDGTTQSKGITSNAMWVSEKLEGLKKGTPISFSLENNGGTYHMYVYINGAFNKHRDAGGGGTQTLETSIPN